jgi:hypothetical protein
VAEVVWGALADRQDALRLAALAVIGLGAKRMEDYEPPSVVLAETVSEVPEAKIAPVERGEARRAEVAAFVAAMGGETG